MERSQARVHRLILMDGHEQQYLQLQEAGAGSSARKLTMVIGQTAAVEISNCLKGQQPVRPMSADLTHAILERLDGKVQEVLIHEVQEGTYYAELRLLRGEEVFGIDCRPSDAISLSLRSSAPIYVTEKVWRQATG